MTQPGPGICWCCDYIMSDRYPHIPGCPNQGKTANQLIAEAIDNARAQRELGRKIRGENKNA